MLIRKWLAICCMGVVLSSLASSLVYAKGASTCEDLFKSKQFNQALPLCLEAAKQGHIDAQYTLGLMYAYGQGVEQSYVDAVKWYRKAADQGYATAQYHLGLTYDNGLGLEQSYVDAARWYRKAAEQGYANAQFNLGVMYAYGQGVQQSYVDAVKWYRKAAEQGYANAQFNLGVMYAYGQGVQQSYVDAVKWYRKAAEQGYANAQNNLGLLYENGQGVQQNYLDAVKWYHKAAEQGVARAQNNLGLKYAYGQGIQQSYADAAQWFRKAAEQGYASAQYHLGLTYDNGLGVEQSYVDAAKWYRKAAEQGHANAQHNLGLMYENGKGVEQSYVDAAKWYRKAAEQGDANAQHNLGRMHKYGKGVEQSYANAVKWFRKAAEQGYAAAQFNLGVMYAYGLGVVQSGAASADWYYKAGISSFMNNDRERVLQCVERIQGLQKHLFLSVPNAFLADKLLKKIYANNKPKKDDGKAAKKQYVTGTGWPVKGGYVVTNNHVIAGQASIVLVRADGATTPAHVVLTDTVNDLALLLPEDKKFLPTALPLAEMIADVGEQVFTLGYPHPDMMGKEAKLTDGIINSRTGMRNDPRVYQISVQLQGGNSGGPLLNMHGEVVGVTTSKMSAVKVFKWIGDLPQNVNYAVKIGYLKMLLSAVDPAGDLPVLAPLKGGALRDLSKHIEGSVLMIIAK